MSWMDDALAELESAGSNLSYKQKQERRALIALTDKERDEQRRATSHPRSPCVRCGVRGDVHEQMGCSNYARGRDA